MPKMSKSAMRKQMLDMAEGGETETPETKASESETETPQGTMETESTDTASPDNAPAGNDKMVKEMNDLVDNFKSELDAGGDPKELATKLAEDLKAACGSEDTSNQEAPLNMPPSDMMG